MAIARDIPDLLQLLCEARCNADAYFSDVIVVRVDHGDTEQDLSQKLATLLGKGGKIGVAIFILPITDAADKFDNVADGPLDLPVSFQVVENRMLNKTASGTQKTAGQIARHLHSIFKIFSIVGVAEVFRSDADAIKAVPLANPALKSKFQMKEVNFRCREAHKKTFDHVARPILSPSAGAATTVAITCATAGAKIYYTTDGSPPWSGNTAATLYTAPIDVPAEGLSLLVGAYPDPEGTYAYASNIIAAIFTQAP